MVYQVPSLYNSNYNETLTTSLLRPREHPPCPAEDRSLFFPFPVCRAQINGAIRVAPWTLCWGGFRKVVIIFVRCLALRSTLEDRFIHWHQIFGRR